VCETEVLLEFLADGVKSKSRVFLVTLGDADVDRL
jgi:hypothetical protein